MVGSYLSVAGMGPMFHLLGIYDRWLTPASLGGRWVVTWRCASHRQEAEEAKRQQEEAQKLEVARQAVAVARGGLAPASPKTEGGRHPGDVVIGFVWFSVPGGGSTPRRSSTPTSGPEGKGMALAKPRDGGGRR